MSKIVLIESPARISWIRAAQIAAGGDSAHANIPRLPPIRRCLAMRQPRHPPPGRIEMTDHGPNLTRGLHRGGIRMRSGGKHDSRARKPRTCGNQSSGISRADKLYRRSITCEKTGPRSCRVVVKARFLHSVPGPDRVTSSAAINSTSSTTSP